MTGKTTQAAGTTAAYGRLQGKDLINIGIYAAIYIVSMTAIAMLGYIPVLMPLLCVLVPLVGGIPMMLFLTKVGKPGMVFIFSLICGIYLAITGMGIVVPFVAAATGFLAELVLKSGGYRSSGKMILAYGIFSVFIIGNFIPMWTDSSYFASMVGNGYTQEYADALQSFMPLWMFPVLTASCFVSGIIGGFFGRKVLKKHFAKAGIV